jgi:hypothetical protein
VHTAAADVEAAGGKALAVVGDVRREEDVVRVVEAAVQRFGGVDVCVNNASAIAVDPTAQLSANPHVLTISPPVNMNPHWLGAHPSYTLSKYTCSGCRRVNVYARQMISPCGIASQPSGAAAQVRHAAEISSSCAVVARPNRKMSRAMPECRIRSAHIPPHQSRVSGVA